MEQKPWWQNMKHDWTVDQLDSMICRRCGLRAKSKHEGEQHECVPEKVNSWRMNQAGSWPPLESGRAFG